MKMVINYDDDEFDYDNDKVDKMFFFVVLRIIFKTMCFLDVCENLLPIKDKVDDDDDCDDIVDDEVDSDDNDGEDDNNYSFLNLSYLGLLSSCHPNCP